MICIKNEQLISYIIEQQASSFVLSKVQRDALNTFLTVGLGTPDYFTLGCIANIVGNKQRFVINRHHDVWNLKLVLRS